MGKGVLNNNHFKAKDIYSLWSNRCKKAERSICVISSYVDNIVKNLLSSNELETYIEKSIYTRIDSDTIFEKPYQISALIKCKKIVSARNTAYRLAGSFHRSLF